MRGFIPEALRLLTVLADARSARPTSSGRLRRPSADLALVPPMSGQGQLRQRLQPAQDAYVAAAIVLSTTRTTSTTTATSSTSDQTMTISLDRPRCAGDASGRLQLVEELQPAAKPSP